MQENEPQRSIMKLSELKGRAVVSLDGAKKIGEVEDLLVQPDSYHIASLKIRTGLFSAARLVPTTDVKNVGADAVTVSVNTSQVSIPANTSNAGNTDQLEVEQWGANTKSSESSGPLFEISKILGNKVVTDAGTMLGELHDVLFDWVDLRITGFEVRESGLFAKTQEFAATPEVRYGKTMITIPAQLLSQPK
jgi:sporulation protein YlmC with PRC-barrel domain